MEVVFHDSSCWVKIRLHTENQLRVLPGSALRSFGWGGGVGGGVVGWDGPSHYVVTPTQVEVELRLSWAVTIILYMSCVKPVFKIVLFSS
jgi:hypothetical protein